MLVYRNFRYFKWAALLVLASVIAYWLHQPFAGVPNGGTWLGYVLGTIGAGIIFWLTYLGIRKRRYGIHREGAGKDKRKDGIKLEDWVSAHIYFGLSLIIVATLHTGFQFGWNLHTLAYALMIIVIVSGIFGVYAYIRYPQLMTENRRGLTLNNMLAQVADLDKEMRGITMSMGENINAAVLRAAQETRVGGSFGRMLAGQDASCPTTAARVLVEQVAHQPHDDEAALRRLLSLLVRKEELLRRARRDVQFSALMQIWLFVHVPLSFGLLAALTAHIVSVFFYW